MAEQVNVDQVVLQVMDGLSTIIGEAARLEQAKMVLYMSLADLQIYREETALSTEVDYTEEYYRQYLVNMRLNGCTDNSISGYAYELRRMLGHVNKGIKNIKINDLRGYLAWGKMVRHWSDRTYNVKLIMIRSFFGWLYEEDLISDNPAKKLKETKVERKMGPTLNPVQREEVRCACQDERELAICDLLYSSGIRVSELCGLNRADIDFTSLKAIVYGKGRKEREVYFTGQALVHLQKYLESRTDDNPALFVGTRQPHNRIRPDAVRAILKKVKGRDQDLAGIRLTPHVFRRTVGTDMINRGAPLELVAEKLGHVQLDTTKQCYAAISRETVHQAHNRYVS